MTRRGVPARPRGTIQQEQSKGLAMGRQEQPATTALVPDHMAECATDERQLCTGGNRVPARQSPKAKQRGGMHGCLAAPVCRLTEGKPPRQQSSTSRSRSTSVSASVAA